MTRLDRLSNEKKVFLIFALGVCFCLLLILFADKYLQALTTVPESRNDQHETDSGHEKESRYNVDIANIGEVASGTTTQIEVGIHDTKHKLKLTSSELQPDRKPYIVFVNSELDYFMKVSPSDDNLFSFTTSFPMAGVYVGYLVFQPVDEGRQTRSFNIYVDGAEFVEATQRLDNNFEKKDKQLKFTLLNPNDYAANEISKGDKGLEIKIDGVGADFNPSSMYVVLFNQHSYDMVRTHEHNEVGDTTLTFDIEHGMTIKAGQYRVFVQVEYLGEMHQADYTIEVR